MKLARDIQTDGYGVVPFSSIVNYANTFLIPDSFEELYKVVTSLDAEMYEMYKRSQQRKKVNG